jgi:hypothetical protein
MKPLLIMTNSKTGKALPISVEVSVGRSPDGCLAIIIASEELQSYLHSQLTLLLSEDRIPK